MTVSQEFEARKLRSWIAMIEARYDNHFPPQVYAVLAKMRREYAYVMHELKENSR